MRKEIILSAVLTVLSLAIAFAAGFFTHQFLYPRELELPLLSQARTIIENHAYYPIPEDPALEYGMIHGMVSALDDPYASFVEPIQHELESDNFAGEFGGIGAEVSLDENNQVVLFPFPDSPAREAGIEDGDIVRGVDGVEVTPDTGIDGVVAMVRGPVGERVKITVFRPSEETEYTFTIKRASYTLPSVAYRPLDQYPQIGLIDVNLIASSTANEISTAVNELQSQGVEYFILDLQGNGGGLLNAGIDIAGLFLKDGEVMTQQYEGQDPEVFNVKQPGPFSELPLAVLIDHGSASASEIIAGALQAHQRALLIGSPSYGKNTIQLVFTLEDNSSIHVTSAVWWPPGGSADMDFQLIPDIAVDPENAGYDQVIQLAVDYFLEE